MRSRSVSRSASSSSGATTSAAATVAPASANSSQTALPSAPLAPVTSATSPLKSKLTLMRDRESTRTRLKRWDEEARGGGFERRRAPNRSRTVQVKHDHEEQQERN